MERDMAKLTKNGKHPTPESDDDWLLNFLLRMAADHQATSEALRRRAALFADRRKTYRGEE
jgi:hypothetical protein